MHYLDTKMCCLGIIITLGSYGHASTQSFIKRLIVQNECSIPKKLMFQLENAHNNLPYLCCFVHPESLGVLF